VLVASWLLAFGIAAAQAPNSEKQRITIKLVNGKTDRPVWWRGLAYVRVGDAITANKGFSDKRTNLIGEANVDVTGANPPKVEVNADFISRDCRDRVPITSPLPLRLYEIDEIRKKGVVSDNFCGGPTRVPKPGVLVIYVIPMTLRELWNM
jgi:hypothetical protein